MTNRKVLRRLCLTGFLAATMAMAGCAGDDGKVGAIGAEGPEGPQGPPGADFEIGDNVLAGVGACLTCHAATIAEDQLESKHVIHSTHISRSSEASCLECHDPLDEGWRLEKYLDSSNVPAGGLAAVTCEACHGASSNHANLPLKYKPEFVQPDSSKCGECHSTLLASHIPHHPFADEIADRFATSRHGDRGARNSMPSESEPDGRTCAACHSHEGAQILLAKQRFTSRAQLDGLRADLAALGETLSKKQCATCHDSHATGLRGVGDVLDADGDVKFSAEFNLCTACHMVDLTATLEGHGDAGNLYKYELSDKYTSANLWDAEAGTFDYSKTVYQHDGDSSNTRVFVDTHFAGIIAQRLVEFDDSGLGDDVVLKGYNINAGSRNACTICHDPHTAGKMLSVAEGQADNPDNAAVSYAEGLGDFHTNYLGGAMGHGCLPCHSGDSFVPVTLGAALPSGSGTSSIGCRTCHDLAVANAEPSLNSPELYAEVREFPADYEFAFNSGVVVTDDLGNNRVCFECHKGRTGGISVAEQNALPAGETQVRAFSYLHYAPAVATLFGNDSGMFPVYDGKTYAGRFVHGGGEAGQGTANFGCINCHNVHDTNGNDAKTNKMTTSTDCSGCHGAGLFYDAEVLLARTEAFSQRLLETLMDRVLAFDGDATLSQALQDAIAAIAAEPDPFVQQDLLAAHIQGRTNTVPTVAIAHAANVWKIFTYEDGAPHGLTHGHGGSWAHNSKLARQMMYDAIESLGGDLVTPVTINGVGYNLTRP